MKQLRFFMIAAVTVLVTSTSFAQNEDNPWGFTLGFNTIDIREYTTDFSKNLKDYFGSEEWSDNTLPSISRLQISRYLGKGFVAHLDGSINKINFYKSSEDVDALYWSVDAGLNYRLSNLFGKKGWFDPYIGALVAFQDVDLDFVDYNGKKDFMVGGKWGFNIWFNDNIGLNFDSAYKHHFEDNGFDVFQHSIGLAFQLGGKDTDGDGIYDKHDDCPEVPGLKEFNGCPDTDGDGIKDSEDKCPEVAGLAALNGCPDTDGDGIADKFDACPNKKGLKQFNGCPDTDKDGVSDKEDKCVNVAGPRENNGCPWPDTDGDGVLDKDDKCPNEAGLPSLDGCPKKNVDTELDSQMENVLFDTDKSVIKPEYRDNLNNIVRIIGKYSDVKFKLEGHTDSRQTKAYNQRLSQRRANAVMKYLVRKGVDSNRLSTKAYGEDAPASSNSTREGRKLNRRVEIKVDQE